MTVSNKRKLEEVFEAVILQTDGTFDVVTCHDMNTVSDVIFLLMQLCLQTLLWPIKTKTLHKF